MSGWVSGQWVPSGGRAVATGRVSMRTSRRSAGEGGLPPREESLDASTRRRERWMLALRLDRPIQLSEIGPPDHLEAIERLVTGGLLAREGDALLLTARGRFLQNAVAGALVDFDGVA